MNEIIYVFILFLPFEIWLVADLVRFGRSANFDGLFQFYKRFFYYSTWKRRNPDFSIIVVQIIWFLAVIQIR